MYDQNGTVLTKFPEIQSHATDFFIKKTVSQRKL